MRLRPTRTEVSIAVALVLVGLGLWWLAQRYTVGVNLDRSLPWRVWIIERGVRPSVGDFVAFRFEGDAPWFPKGVTFVKQLVGVGGAVVVAERKDGCLFYSVRTPAVSFPIGCFHARSSDGVRLRPGPVGVVPEDRIVVRGFDPASFDSRYAAVGWVRRDAVVGRAIPVL